MDASYKKLTKEDIDFPRYCLFFIRYIQEYINASLDELSYVTPLEIPIKTEYPYCSDAFDLIIKTFEKKGLNVSTPTFKLEIKDNTKYYNYKWRVRKAIDCDDLPF